MEIVKTFVEAKQRQKKFHKVDDLKFFQKDFKGFMFHCCYFISDIFI